MNIEKCIGGPFVVIAESGALVTFKIVERLLKQQKIKPRKPTVRFQPSRNHPAIYTWREPVWIKLKPNTKQPEILAITIKILNNWGYDVEVLKDNQPSLTFECPKIFY